MFKLRVASYPTPTSVILVHIIDKGKAAQIMLYQKSFFIFFNTQSEVIIEKTKTKQTKYNSKE